MATVMQGPVAGRPIDHLVGTPRAHALDRWIFVIMAAWFVVVALAGFIPDSMMKLELIKAGQRAPFPTVAHFHAVLMGSFLLFLLLQTFLVATGRCELHRRIGPLAALLVPALVIAGFLLVPATWFGVWNAISKVPPEAQAGLLQTSALLDNIMLLQIRIGILFPLFIAIGLRARHGDSGFHKRMMIIAPATALPAAFDRMTWLPHTMPASPISPDLYVLLAIAPMFVWDVIRNRRIHRAYWVFLAVAAPITIFVHSVWDTPWWHQTAHRLMGV